MLKCADSKDTHKFGDSFLCGCCGSVTENEHNTGVKPKMCIKQIQTLIQTKGWTS